MHKESKKGKERKKLTNKKGLLNPMVTRVIAPDGSN